MDIKCKSIQIRVGEKNMKTNTSYSGQDFKSLELTMWVRLAGKQASRIHCPYRPEHRSSGTLELSPQPANSIYF